MQDYKKKSIVYKQLNILYLRYAYYFLIFACSKHLVQNYIKPEIKAFFYARGLELFRKKTMLIVIKQENFYFLGYFFVYKQKIEGGDKTRFQDSAYYFGITMVCVEKEKI
jgi:hypothetical protein